MNTEFVTLVKDMREAQKKYFKTRMSHDLEKAKKLEKEIDKSIIEYIENENELKKQMKLF